MSGGCLQDGEQTGKGPAPSCLGHAAFVPWPQHCFLPHQVQTPHRGGSPLPSLQCTSLGLARHASCPHLRFFPCVRPSHPPNSPPSGCRRKLSFPDTRPPSSGVSEKILSRKPGLSSHPTSSPSCLQPSKAHAVTLPRDRADSPAACLFQGPKPSRFCHRMLQQFWK